ncbi:glycosyl hydrolase [Stachybotrys elegans]|uniref:Glycosyl hydrolase n=1 Tax=Stachybotrys elegans TaxID=80388 RepID=A0A8K0SPB2_9HYPO|nr:glycosyl hydrolase [Stachybotrys elegans]
MNSFHRFRPTSHFIAPHSWSNDPCGAVFVPETQEYLICYQWNPGTTDGGNCAWGMAKSRDLVTWEDCMPALWNGTTYDRKGVFSGSIVSRLVDGKRVLYLYYTSVSALPIHWSKPYIHGCESQSVAISSDYGLSWHRHSANPLLASPPKGPATSGWRDPFVSQWPSLSTLLQHDSSTSYMMIASGERGRGPQLHLYQSNDMINWEYTSMLLDVASNFSIPPDSPLLKAVNFECASFFTLDQTDYIIVGIEEPADSSRHNGHCLLWLSGTLCTDDGSPRFRIRGYGFLDHGLLYAAHIFRDAQGRLIQLGWADEAAKQSTIKRQGWAGCLGYPRELIHITRPATGGPVPNGWVLDEDRGQMSTLGVRPAPQVAQLRDAACTRSSLEGFCEMKSTNYEVEATLSGLTGSERLVLDLRASADFAETTKLVVDLAVGQVIVDRSCSSLAGLGAQANDTGYFTLLEGEELRLRFFVDESVLEVFLNERFALTSRIYPSMEASMRVSYDFGAFDTSKVQFRFWEGLGSAWLKRGSATVFDDLHPLKKVDVGAEYEPKREPIKVK